MEKEQEHEQQLSFVEPLYLSLEMYKRLTYHDDAEKLLRLYLAYAARITWIKTPYKGDVTMSQSVGWDMKTFKKHKKTLVDLGLLTIKKVLDEETGEMYKELSVNYF